MEIFIQKKNGIYNAINYGIYRCQGKYYLVAGTDDTINVHMHLDAIKRNSKYDIITAPIIINGVIKYLRPISVSLQGQFFYITGHSVGTLFKTEIHKLYGYYNYHLKLAADQYFVLRIFSVNPRISHLYLKNSIFGIFGSCGLSSQNNFQSFKEMFFVFKKLGMLNLLSSIRLCKILLR